MGQGLALRAGLRAWAGNFLLGVGLLPHVLLEHLHPDDRLPHDFDPGVGSFLFRFCDLAQLGLGLRLGLRLGLGFVTWPCLPPRKPSSESWG